MIFMWSALTLLGHLKGDFTALKFMNIVVTVGNSH